MLGQAIFQESTTLKTLGPTNPKQTISLNPKRGPAEFLGLGALGNQRGVAVVQFDPRFGFRVYKVPLKAHVPKVGNGFAHQKSGFAHQKRIRALCETQDSRTKADGFAH